MKEKINGNVDDIWVGLTEAMDQTATTVLGIKQEQEYKQWFDKDCYVPLKKKSDKKSEKKRK